MDLRKAFDKVSYKLLNKLSYIIRNDKLLFGWIRGYLLKRYQFVTFNGACSVKACVDSGVPQGSLLGLFLFWIFINYTVKDISVNIRLYADDCVLYEKMTRIQTRLNNYFAKVTKWCEEWQMQIMKKPCTRK